MIPQDHKRKIVDLTGLLAEVRRLRAAGRSVVHCHGCFDIVHPGHIRYLEFAGRQGDVLVVTVTGDAAIAKGDQRPYIPQELRAENLAALAFVDLVYVDPNATAESLLSALKPDVYVKGREYETSADPRFLRERATVESYGGRVIFSSGDVVFSSTKLLAALPRAVSLEKRRLGLVCRRHDITGPNLASLLEAFRGLRVGVLGDIIRDRYVFCDAGGVASEAPMLALRQLEQQDYLGGAAIVARHAAALGAEVLLVSSAAEPESSELQQSLAAEHVKLTLLPRRAAVIEKTRYLIEESKVLVVERGASAPLDSQSEKETAAICTDVADSLDALIICDYGYGMVTAGLLERLLPAVRPRIRVIAGDVNGARGSLLHFKDVDLLCPSERELRDTLHDYEEGLSSAAYRLLDQTQTRHLLCTLGRRGLVVFQRQTDDRSNPKWGERLLSEHFPALGGAGVDRLGCGDAMLAASTLSLAAGASLMQAAYVGSAVATIESELVGNRPVDAAMLEAWLADRAELGDAGASAIRHTKDMNGALSAALIGSAEAEDPVAR